MKNRKLIMTAIAACAFLATQLEANHLSLRLMTSATRAFSPAMRYTKPLIVNARNSAKQCIAQTKSAAYEIMKPLENEAILLKHYVRSTHLGQKAEEIFNECLPNETARKLVLFKTCEWAVTMPGFILASKGDTEALAGAAAILSHSGLHGVAANAALLSGAASYYAFEFAKNRYDITTEIMKKNNQNDLVIWSA